MKKICNYAIFNFEESDKNLIDDLASYLDSHVKEIYDFFEVESTNQKIMVNIIPTKNEFDRIFKLKYKTSPDYIVPKNSRGFALPDETIFYLSINDYKNTTHAFKAEDYDKAVEDYKKTLVHEFTHCVNFLFNKKHNCSLTAPYLVEGIAVYLSHQKDNEIYEFDYTLPQLLGKEKCPYSGYYLVTKFFIENYNKKFVLNMFESSREANEFLTNELYNKAVLYYNQNENH